MNWKYAQVMENGLIKAPERWLHLHYYEALNILFRFENSLRVFVYAVLKNKYHDEWKECSFKSSGADSKTIKGLAAIRISQAEYFGYLGFEITSPLMHLTSGELIELITSDAYWPLFKPYFRGNRDIIKNKLNEIGTIRNSLAHFRPIKPDDIELIKQNSRHTMIGIEDCLQNLFVLHIRVPTNTKEDWYSSISTLGTDQITTTPFYSKNEEWVNVQLVFKSPIFDKSGMGQYMYTYSAGKLKTANILIEHPDLMKYVTYISEYVNYPTLNEEYDLIVTKSVNMVFRLDKITEHYPIISGEIQKMLRKVAEECDLLERDNLARGLLVESANIFAWFTEGEKPTWNHEYSDLWQTYDPSHPDEYWGEQQFAGTDIVAGSRRYPWMPSDISRYEPAFG